MSANNKKYEFLPIKFEGGVYFDSQITIDALNKIGQEG